MASYFLLQPNGKLARFTTVTDEITHWDMTEVEAIEVARESMGENDAKDKVARAVRDESVSPDGTRYCEPPLGRWYETLNTIMGCRGTVALYATLEEYPAAWQVESKDRR